MPLLSLHTWEKLPGNSPTSRKPTANRGLGGPFLKPHAWVSFAHLQRMAMRVRSVPRAEYLSVQSDFASGCQSLPFFPCTAHVFSPFYPRNSHVSPPLLSSVQSPAAGSGPHSCPCPLHMQNGWLLLGQGRAYWGMHPAFLRPEGYC